MYPNAIVYFSESKRKLGVECEGESVSARASGILTTARVSLFRGLAAVKVRMCGRGARVALRTALRKSSGLSLDAIVRLCGRNWLLKAMFFGLAAIQRREMQLMMEADSRRL